MDIVILDNYIIFVFVSSIAILGSYTLFSKFTQNAKNFKRIATGTAAVLIAGTTVADTYNNIKKNSGQSNPSGNSGQSNPSGNSGQSNSSGGNTNSNTNDNGSGSSDGKK